MISHTVLVEHAVLFDFRVETVHQDIIATLSGVDEFKAFVGVSTIGIEGSQMVGNRAGVPVVPVRNP